MLESDEDLRQAAGAGNLEAASKLLARYYGTIFAYFRRLCSNESDACDLTQKTFCKVWNGLGSFAGRSAFSTWVHGIAHHVYVDWRRVHSRLEGQTDQWWEAYATPSPNPFDDAAEKDQAGRLFSLVEQLEEDTRETVHLHYYQGLTLQQTADALGVAASTVKYRLRAALDQLRVGVPEPRGRS